MKSTKKIILLIALILLVGCAKASENSNSKPEEEKPEEITFPTPLSGELLKEDISRQRAYAVMLDNHFDAIPQAGLNSADIIYEFKAEGEFTRYMAIFQSKVPDVIGPVRSARPYFVQTAKEYNAIYAHFGGSEAGYAEVKKLGVDDLDGIALDGKTYYRNKNVGKKRPHDAYTSKELMDAQSKEYGYSLEAQNRSFKFDDEKMDGEVCDKLTLHFFKHYTESYEHTDSGYRIIRNENPVIDEADKSEVNVKNVIILFQSSRVTGPLDTLSIQNIGSGDGILLRDGKMKNIHWEKQDVNSPTIFTDENGEISLARGKSFIAICDPDDPLEISPEPQIKDSKEVSDGTQEAK